jgi:hypothetical protein
MMKRMFLLALGACALTSGNLKAGSFEEHFGVAPGQLNAANVQQLTGYATMQGALNAYLCSEDMVRRDKEVQADHAAYNKHLADWVQKNKDAFGAQRLAEAAARQAEIDAYRAALADAFTRSAIRANDSYSNYMNNTRP